MNTSTLAPTTDVEQALLEAFRRYQVDPDAARLAAANLASGKVFLLAVTGKMGSGKDSTAKRVIELLGLEGKAEHTYFAAPLKREVTEAIGFIAERLDDAQVAADLAHDQGIKVEDAQFIVDTLRSDIASGAVKTAWDRTDASRTALQYWGTEIRRSQDEDYWVKKAVADVANTLAQGKSVYVTDARFANEAEALRALFAHLVRLNITREEQDARIFRRDGILPSEAARNHASETSLDTYDGFDQVIASTPELSLDEVSGMIVTEITRKVRNSG